MFIFEDTQYIYCILKQVHNTTGKTYTETINKDLCTSSLKYR